MTAYIAKNTYFLMFAGTDTTSNLLLRIAIVLTRHPEWFQKLQEEQDRLRQEFGDTLDRKVCPEAPAALTRAACSAPARIPVLHSTWTQTVDRCRGVTDGEGAGMRPGLL